MDPTTSLVFQTIGRIKKSLECSICLDLLNDPHSTRCNHQFCSRCIRKVVDERKDKKKEALCPLCKSPITKRSLTSNPRLKEIVDVVRKLNTAFQEDAGIPDSPYPLVNLKISKETSGYQQFAHWKPTPLKLSKFNDPKLGDHTSKLHLESGIKDQFGKQSLQDRQQLSHDEGCTTPQKFEKQRSTIGLEILSLLESEANAQSEASPKQMQLKDEDSEEVIKTTVQQNLRCSNTINGSQPTESQTARSQEMVDTATGTTKSSGSQTIDPGELSQCSVISKNSESVLNELLSSEEGGIQPDLTREDRSITVYKQDEPQDQERNDDNCSSPINNQDNSKRFEGKSNRESSFSNSKDKQDTSKSFQEENNNNFPSSLSKNKHGCSKHLQEDNESTSLSFVPNNREGNSASFQEEGNGQSPSSTPDNIQDISQQSQEEKFGSANSSLLKSKNKVDNSKLFQEKSDGRSFLWLSQNKQDSSKHQVVDNGTSHSDSSIARRNIDSNNTVDSRINPIEMCSEIQQSLNDECKKSTIEVDTSGSKPSPIDVSQSYANEENCKQSSSECVLASVDSDSQAYKVIPLPRYQESDSEIFSELVSLHSRTVFSNAEEEELSDEISPTIEKICSPPLHSLLSEQELMRQKSDFASPNEDPSVRLSTETSPRSLAQDCRHSEELTLLPSTSVSCSRQLSSKRKLPGSPGDANSGRKYKRLSSKKNATKEKLIAPDDSVGNDPFKSVQSSSVNEAHGQLEHFARKTSCVNEAPKRLCTKKYKLVHHAVKTSNDNRSKGENESEDEVIPPTPPVEMSQSTSSPRKIDNASVGLSGQSKSSLQLSGGEKRVHETEEFDENDCLVDVDVRDIDDAYNNDDLDDGEDNGIMINFVGEPSPNRDDDGMCSSQGFDRPDDEDNVALLRRLGSGSANRKQSESESDGEISDCKTGDTTSISSLTDVDAVEISTQRVKYLNDVLAQTGGEIEKLTADLKNLRKTKTEAVEHVDTDNEVDNKNEDKLHSSFEKKEQIYLCEEKNKRCPDSESENERCNVSDSEDEMHVNNAAESSLEEHEEDSDNSDEENDMRKSSNDEGLSSDIVRHNTKSEKENKQKLAKDSDVEAIVIEDIDNNDEEIPERDSLSPPPSVEVSSLQLTKLPPAIKNMQRLLADSEDEQDIGCQIHQSNLDAKQKNLSLNKEVLQNKESSDALASNRRCNDSLRVGKSAGITVPSSDHRSRDSQKENNAERSSSGDIPTRRPQSLSKQHSTEQKHPLDGVLVDLKIQNAGVKHRTLGNVLHNGSKRVTTHAGKSSVCFAVTRLPKQFVSLVGYLAKKHGGKVFGEVSEETTHVIMPTDSRMHANRRNYTIKYFLGVAMGKWIVSQLWVTACVKSGRLVNEIMNVYECNGKNIFMSENSRAMEKNICTARACNGNFHCTEDYEVKGDVETSQSHVPKLARITRKNKDPLLFDSISVACFGEFSGAISQDHVCQLIRYCGGQVVDFNRGILQCNSMISDLIVICDAQFSKEQEVVVKDLCERYGTFPVSVEFITDSVANYQLQNLEEYRMDI